MYRLIIQPARKPDHASSLEKLKYMNTPCTCLLPVSFPLGHFGQSDLNPVSSLDTGGND